MTGRPLDDAALRRRPRRYPRFVLSLIYALEACCRVVLRGRSLYSRQLARTLRVREVAIEIEGLPPALDGLRIAHLSDFHAGPFLDADSLAPVIGRLNALAPDLLCLTGDFLTHRVEEGIALAAAFSSVRPRLGGFLVFGNHDYRARREHEMAAAFALPLGIRALRNDGAVVESGGARLFVAGIEDVEEGKEVDLDRALAGRRPDDITILLAHHPDVAADVATDVAPANEPERAADSRVSARHPVDLVLSGHTHGGQIVLFGRSIFGGSLRSRFPVGLTSLGRLRLHVTSGIGVLILPLRIHAPPEIALLTLKRPSA